jgi:hypothetical protein
MAPSLKFEIVEKAIVSRDELFAVASEQYMKRYVERSLKY